MTAREPRTLPATHGLRWAREGLEIFAASPAAWTGITILFLLIGVVLSIIPMAGMLWCVVVPIHAGGLMLGCRALRQGRPLEVRHLFNGFEAPRVQPLALVGALYLAGSLVVMLPLIVIMVGGALLSAFAVGASGASAGALTGVGLLGLLVALLMMAAALALSLALWFAPALVVFDEREAIDALTLSLRAGWANVGAFVVYAMVLLAVALLAATPLVAAIALAAVSGEQAGPFAIVAIGGTACFALLCMVLLLPAAWGAMYASYEDVFLAGGV